MDELSRYIIDLSELIDIIEMSDNSSLALDFTLPVLKKYLAEAETVAERVAAYTKSPMTMMGEIKQDDDDVRYDHFEWED